VQEAVRRIKRSGFGMLGAKRLVQKIRQDYPELEASGVVVGAKQVRAAMDALSSVGLATPERAGPSAAAAAAAAPAEP
jgi:hypothetical protein